MNAQPKRLLDQVRDVIRVKHYSPRTEQAYVEWITRFILFHDKRHPRDMGDLEIEAFLTHLAVEHHVAASTQNQALYALRQQFPFCSRDFVGLRQSAIACTFPRKPPYAIAKSRLRPDFSPITGIAGSRASRRYGCAILPTRSACGTPVGVGCPLIIPKLPWKCV